MLNIKSFFVGIVAISLIFFGFCVFAQTNNLVVVYPQNNASINASSTFFVGHTNPNATLTINGAPVKVYSNGSFVRVFNLHKGKNNVVLRSYLNNIPVTKQFTINVPTSAKRGATVVKPVFRPMNAAFEVISDETPLRTSPYVGRLTPVKKGVIIKSLGVLDNHHKVDLGNNKFAYVSQKAVSDIPVNKCENQILQKIIFNEDMKDIIIKIPVRQPVLVELMQKKNRLTVRLVGTNLSFDKYYTKSPYIEDFSYESDNFTIDIATNELNGFDYQYINNIFELRIRKPFTRGLRGKIIAIDAGHGGKECGSIGPTEIPEKDINLAISKFLKEKLEQKGAKVIMTRKSDEYVGIYERIDIAKAANADVLISIHNNALPDGQNPYVVHGTSTYYYHPQALALANAVQKKLLNYTGFKDHGVKHGSLALARPTLPVSILIEVGFMINPFEYAALLNVDNQKAYAQGICEGLQLYFSN